MRPLRFRYQTLEFGDDDIHVRSLRDPGQFADEKGEAEALNISSEQWPLFGLLWEAGRALARLMADYDVGDKRILEVGCGLALSSLVLNQRGCDVTASDHHPEAQAFLNVNTALNGDPQVPFERTAWADHDDALGTFDLIIGSDLLYTRQDIAELAGFIDRHARPAAVVILVDPGRGHRGRFERTMADHGYAGTRTWASKGPDKPFVGQIMTFTR